MHFCVIIGMIYNYIGPVMQIHVYRQENEDFRIMQLTIFLSSNINPIFIRTDSCDILIQIDVCSGQRDNSWMSAKKLLRSSRQIFPSLGAYLKQMGPSPQCSYQIGTLKTHSTCN